MVFSRFVAYYRKLPLREECDTMQTFVRAKVTQGGRIVIPAEMRKQLGVEIGEDVNLSFVDGSVTISSQKEGIRKAQELFRKFVPEGVSIVDELIADRRREVDDE